MKTKPTNPSLSLSLSFSLSPACIPSFQLVKPEEIHHSSASSAKTPPPPILCPDGSVTFSQLADLTGSSARSSFAPGLLPPCSLSLSLSRLSLSLKCYSRVPGDIAYYILALMLFCLFAFSSPDSLLPLGAALYPALLICPPGPPSCEKYLQNHWKSLPGMQLCLFYLSPLLRPWNGGHAL